MEVTALCIRLLMTVLMLLVSHVEQSHPQTDAAFRIVPTRLQLFEYGSVRFTCEGFNVSAGWKVRNIKEFIPHCSNGTVTSTVTCTIDYAFVSDSGEYWCEGGGGERSNTVNITVTDGSVILESPVLPVMEEDAMTLSCRKKTTTSNLTADFYKDGLLIGTSSTGNMTIEIVSKSHDGLYKCNIPGAGESPESRLAVRGKYNGGEGGSVILESPALPVTEGDAVTLRCRKKETSSDVKADFYKDGHLMDSSSTGEVTIHSVSKSDEGLYKCRISEAGESAERRLSVKVLVEKNNGSVKQSEDSNTQQADRRASDKEINFARHYYILLWIVITVTLVLQLLVMGLLYWKKQLVLLEAKMKDLNKDMYAVVRKDKKKKDAADAADNLSLCLDTNHSAKPQTEKDEDEPLPQSFHSTFAIDGTLQALQNESGVSSFTVTAAPSAATDPPLTDEDPQYASIQEITEEETPY